MPAPGEGKTGPSLNTKYYQVNPNGQVGTKKTIDMAFTNQDATNAMNPCRIFYNHRCTSK